MTLTTTLRQQTQSVLRLPGRLLSPRRPEPSYPRLPAVDEHGQTNVRGVYAVGEVAGTPLIKLGLNAGHELVQRLAAELRKEGPGPENAHDLVILGGGSAGLGAADAAQQLGLKAVVLEANHLAETVYTMTKGKLILAEPEGVEKSGRLWFEECTREQLLQRWQAQVGELGLDIRTFERVEDVQRQGDLLAVTSTKGQYLCRRFLLACGKAGNPRKAGVPGEVEHAPRIDHRLIDPDRHQDQDILIYGGGDVALEAAVTLCETNRVTLVTIDSEFTFPKKRNVDALRAREAEGKIAVHMSSFLAAVGERDVSFAVGAPDGPRTTIPNDHLFEMIGAELPLPFFQKIGVQLENTWNRKRWVMLFVTFLLIYAFYSLKSYGKGLASWPFDRLIAPEAFDTGLRALFRVAFAPFSVLFTPEAYQDILHDPDHARGFQAGYLYSLLYTIVMVVFGWQALLRWTGVARDQRYQTWRYASLIGFQVGFFLLVNVVAVHALSLKNAWRAWGLYQPFPLFFNVFFWWDKDGDPRAVMWFFVVAGLIATFVIIPLLSRWHGKRFCTWICGCGGLAETLGDRWRHLAAKGERSRRWEFQSTAVLLAAFLVLVICVTAYQGSGSNVWWNTYNYLVDFWMVAVIPIALYPFFGGKIWCRYWCPLAAWNQFLARWFGKLKITSSEKCISCTQCSKFCQVGVDVMAFAKNQVPFDNRNSSCIQCGICIDVCPMGVLEFDTSALIDARGNPKTD